MTHHSMDSTKTVDTIIMARWVVPIYPRKVILNNHSVVINQGRIVDIVSNNQVLNHYQSKEILQRPDHVLMPGLVNAHTHLGLNLLRSCLPDNLSLQDWLAQLQHQEINLFARKGVGLGSELAMAEMIRSGTSCFNNMYFFPLETEKSALKCGMRGTVCTHVMTIKNAWANGEADALEKARKILRQRQPHPLITWTIAPHSPYATSDKGLRQCKELSDHYNLKMNIHLHETQIETSASSVRPIQRLDNLGLLSSQCIAIHMVDLNDDEISLIKQRGVNVVHCPESNLKLGAGIAPITKLLAAGVNVALGTDSVVSNDNLDMFGEMRTAALIAKGGEQKADVLPAWQALEMATLNGAKALGLENEIGSLKIGKSADMIAVNLGHLFTQPVHDIASLLVYAVNCLQVSDMWVAGNPLLIDGQFTQIDQTELLARVKQWHNHSLQNTH